MTATKESNCSHPILAATYREWMSKDGNIEKKKKRIALILK